jgi:hypothetical protein
MECNLLHDCQARFERIDKCLDEQKKDHDMVIELKTKIDNLTYSVKSLTHSIWGMIGTVLALLAGFFIWFIQSIGR